MNFEMGQRVVQIIEGPNSRTATLTTVKEVGRDVVNVVGSGLDYGLNDGRERNPPLPGWRSYLAILE